MDGPATKFQHMFGLSNPHTVECVDQIVIHAQMTNVWACPIKERSYGRAIYLHDSVRLQAVRQLWTIPSGILPVSS